MLNVKLTDKPCLFCGVREDTVFAKCKEHEFTGVVCPKHMIALLKKWETSEAKAEEPAKV